MTLGLVEIDYKKYRPRYTCHFIDLWLAIAWRPSWKYANRKVLAETQVRSLEHLRLDTQFIMYSGIQLR